MSAHSLASRVLAALTVELLDALGIASRVETCCTNDVSTRRLVDVIDELHRLCDDGTAERMPTEQGAMGYRLATMKAMA